MCSAITDTPYTQMVVAAFIPAILYYFGLIVQVDSYAVKVGLKGLKQEDVPNLWKTLKEGWPFILVLAFLVFGLIYMRWGVAAPIYAAGLMFVLSFRSRKTMMTPRRIVEALVTIGGLIVLITAIMLCVGFILIGIQATGAFVSLTTALMGGGQSLAMVLLIAVAVCYIFGMIGVAMPIYIVLAVTFVPALVTATGLNFLAVHLFLIYYINMQGITPPVCTVAFLGAAMAGSAPMRTGFTSMRLGIVLLFLPFFFLFNPSLILQGTILRTIYLFALCLVGIWILGSGLEGYLLKVGRLSWWSRPLLVVGGFLIAFPGWMTTGIGAVLTVVAVALILIRRRMIA